MEWLGPQRSNDLVEAYMMYVETCVSENDKIRVIHPDTTVLDWSKTHKTLSDTSTRTASFRELPVAADDDDDKGEEGDDDDEDEDDDDEDNGADAGADADADAQSDVGTRSRRGVLNRPTRQGSAALSSKGSSTPTPENVVAKERP